MDLRRARAAVVVTMLSAAAGAIAGLVVALGLGILFPTHGDGLTLLFGGSVLGFAVAALLLWRRFRAQPAAAEKVTR